MNDLPSNLVNERMTDRMSERMTDQSIGVRDFITKRAFNLCLLYCPRNWSWSWFAQFSFACPFLSGLCRGSRQLQDPGLFYRGVLSLSIRHRIQIHRYELLVGLFVQLSVQPSVQLFNQPSVQPYVQPSVQPSAIQQIGVKESQGAVLT